MVRREKMTIFLEVSEETSVLEVKKMLEPLVKKSPEEQQLYRIDTKKALEDNKTLGDCGYRTQSCKAMDPGCVGLAFKIGE